MLVEGKVIIVTGASMGIGLAVSRLLAASKAKVVLAARSADKLTELQKEIPDSHFIVTDMCKSSDVDRMIEETREKYGRIDVLINNAGRGYQQTNIADIDMTIYREIMELNLFSVLHAMQKVIPIMKSQADGGMILNISSVVSKNYIPHVGAYASTKYALNALSLTARQELADDGIIVSVFHPKMTATEFGMNNAGKKYRSADGKPGLPLDTAEDVAAAILGQIKSEEAEFTM
jgi:short-subunit dehydrogenase